MTEISYTLICKDSKIRRAREPHSGSALAKLVTRPPKKVRIGGKPMVMLGYGGQKLPYSLEGKVYRYEYKRVVNAWPLPVGMMISFFLLGTVWFYLVLLGGMAMAFIFYGATYEGRNMIWFEGNPTPFNHTESRWRSALDDSAYMIKAIRDSEAPDRFMLPRKIDWSLIIAGAGIGLVIGVLLGTLIR